MFTYHARSIKKIDDKVLKIFNAGIYIHKYMQVKEHKQAFDFHPYMHLWILIPKYVLVDDK